MNLQELMELSNNKELYDSILLTNDCSKENLTKISQQLNNTYYRLSVLETPTSELYKLTDFWLEIQSISDELDTMCNKSFAVYDKSYNFIGISDKNMGTGLFLKRNAHAVFTLLVYGFTKIEIMEILHVSRSYISLVMKTLRDKCQSLLEFYGEINSSIPAFKMF